MENKKCNICHEEKPITEFYSQNKYSEVRGNYVYYQPYCKSCAIKKQQGKYWSDPEVGREKSRKWLRENKERHDIMRRTWKSNNEEYAKEISSNWRKENKEKVKEYRVERYMHKKHEINDVEWEMCKEFFNFECAYCGLPIEEHYVTYKGKVILGDFHKEHFDHDGSNDITNCIPSCKSCNVKKHDKNFEEWYNEDNSIFSEERLHMICKWIFEVVHSI